MFRSCDATNLNLSPLCNILSENNDKEVSAGLGWAVLGWDGLGWAGQGSVSCGVCRPPCGGRRPGSPTTRPTPRTTPAASSAP